MALNIATTQSCADSGAVLEMLSRKQSASWVETKVVRDYLKLASIHTAPLKYSDNGKAR